MKGFAPYRSIRPCDPWRWTVLAVAWVFVGLFLFAAAHEAVPGLCTLLDEDTPCAFCELIFMLAVAVAVVAILRRQGFLFLSRPLTFAAPPEPEPCKNLSPRAPPFSALGGGSVVEPVPVVS